MAFPAVRAGAATSTTPTVGTSHTVNLPSTVESGDYLFAAIMCGNASVDFSTVASGWSLLVEVDNAAVGSLAVFAKTADGTEDGGTLAVTSSFGRITAHCAFAISGWNGTTTAEVTSAIYAFAEPDPPALTPAGGADDYLWLEIAGNEDSGTYTFSTTPSTFAAIAQTNSGGATAGDASIGAGSLQSNASTLDPGAMTCTAPNDKGCVVTIAITPATAGGGITGGMAVTEAVDTVAFDGDVIIQGDLATTEAADVVAFDGELQRIGTLAVTEGTDIVAFVGGVVISGDMVTTEDSDAVVFDGTTPVVIVVIRFDPLALLPNNIMPTASRIAALVEFVEDNDRLPTAEEVETLLGVSAIDYGTTTDPLPDGFAGRDWNNPHWLKRLVNNA